MTIATTASKVTLSGNGIATLFPYGFEIPSATSTDQANVIVTITDTTVSPAVTAVLGTNQYSIDGINNPAGGNVTYPLAGSPIAAGVYITIQRNIPYTQPFDFPNQSAFLGTVVTQAYDWCVMQIQQLRTTLQYALTFPQTDLTPPATLPPAAQRANTYFGFDAAGAWTLLGIPSPTPGTGGALAFRTVTSSTAMIDTDNIVYCNAASGPQANTLPAVADVAGRLMILKKTDATANPVTIAGDAQIDGQASFTLGQQFNTIGLSSDGIGWNILWQF